MENNELQSIIETIAQQAQVASHELATTHTELKNKMLETLADLIEANTDTLIEENQKDLIAGKENGLAKPMLDRLTFNTDRISNMAEGVRQVAALPDPVGQILEKTERPNGVEIRKVRVPIGVVGIIYESRPNVTIDCAALCLKSGNASILRGGKEAFHSNTALAKLIQQALQQSGINEHAVQLIPTTDRAALGYLIKLNQYIDCIIPRGGEGLIRFVVEHGSIPVIKHYTGVCSVYVDKSVDTEIAKNIIINAKCQRPSVCNAIENLFVHEDILNDAFCEIAQSLHDNNVEIRADAAGQTALEGKVPTTLATDEDYGTEFLDLIISTKTVASVEEAIAAINQYGSKHSDCVLTEDAATAEKFLNGIDAATVYWNASTRFTDGFEFGLGAEIGISTDKLHARGPMGLNELCTYKYQIYGTGQIKP